MIYKKILKFILSISTIFNFQANAINISDMSLEEKLGQMVCLSFRYWDNQNSNTSSKTPFTEINSDVKSILSKYHIGSIILFSQNFVNKEQSKTLIENLQSTATKSGNPPLIIAVDQEGGKVERFSFERDRLKNNSEIKSSKEAFEKGSIIAKELRELGINCNFAPVLDINSNPNNPVINVRSFGDNADTVSEFGKSFLKGLHSENILGVAKHFPGHGDTSIDSHLGLPIVNKSLNDLENMELKPFREISKNGVDMVMVAHISLPKIEINTAISKKTGGKIYLPATLSKTIITDILRNKIGFNGVVITDALNMNAISENFGENEAAKMAINAGDDMLCMPVILESQNDIDKLDKLFNYLKNAVANGEISEKQIDASVQRIIKLKEKQLNLR